MSMEYTLDIQLTELGFPDVLQPEDASVSQEPSDEPSSRSLSAARKRRRLLRDGQEAAAPPARKCSASPHLPETVPCKRLTRAESRDSQGVNGAAVKDPPSEAPLVAECEESGGKRLDEEKAQEDVEEDSDDSEVSEIYEDEELDDEDDDDDDDEEEELSNETSNSGDFRCSVCDLQLPSKFKLQDHMNLHTGARPYCCAECGKRFCQIYNYRVHLRTHAKIKVERHWCRICLTGFGSQEHLKRHLSRTHFEDLFYECDLCKRVFTSLKECEAHVQLHKCMVNIVCDVCGRNFPSEKSLARHRKKRCLRNFKCTDCTKTFTKKNALLKHSFSHLGLLPYTCVRCRCHFRLAKLYRQHKCEPQRIHCVACLREFLSQEDFQQHKKDTGCWGNQEPNQRKDEIRCLECGQRFDTSEELKKHAGAHQRVLKCAECGKGFRSALLLMSHMGGHAGKSPCFCQTCGLGFPHQQNYDGHLKTCGQPSQSVSVPKRRKTLKSSLPEQTLKKRAKPDSTNISSTFKVPGVVLNNPAASEKDSRSPGLVAGRDPAGSAPSDGLWSLTLDKEPPPGMNLVLFLPVCPTQTNGLVSAVPQTLPVAAVQPLPQASLSPASNNELLGVKGALGASLHPPLQLLTGVKGDTVAPLDLSKKCNPSKSEVSDVPIKSEPVDFEASGQANGTEPQEAQKHRSREEIIKTDAGETYARSEAKRFETDPVANTASPGLASHIKNEPDSPGPDSDAPSPASIQLTDCGPEKDIKKEV
ncbi:uncharacterized protein PAE49_005557 [Odontesthes bonariensis]|uniref:uncharacterized protein LOC142380728 n=1 Tax=Odontesthes bonariensis TaxID=219752 RepID=UPI003F5813C1